MIDKIKEINEDIEMEDWAEERLKKNKERQKCFDDDSINKVVSIGKDRILTFSKELEGGKDNNG